MGQTRNDTHEQSAARYATAEKLRCPKCQRKAALSAKTTFDWGWVRECRYCGHGVGWDRDRQATFGRAPLPGDTG